MSSSTPSPTTWAEANATVQDLTATVARREVRIAEQVNALLLRREQSLLKLETTQLQRAEVVRDRFPKEEGDESDYDSGDESDEETESKEPVVPSAQEVEPEASLASPPQTSPDEVPTVAAAKVTSSSTSTSDLDDDSDTNSLFDGDVDESSFDFLTTAPAQLDGGEATDAACESTALVPTAGIPRDTQASVVVRVEGAKAKPTGRNGEVNAVRPSESLSPVKRTFPPLALPKRAVLTQLRGSEVTDAARSGVPSVPTSVIPGSQASAVVKTALPTPKPSTSPVVDLTGNDKTAAQGQKTAVAGQTMSAKKAGKRPRAAEPDDDEQAYAIQSKIRLLQHQEQQDFLRAQQLSLAQHVGPQDGQPGQSSWGQQQQQHLAPQQKMQNMVAGSSTYQHALQQPMESASQPDYLAMLQQQQQQQQQQYHAAMQQIASQYNAAMPVPSTTYMAYQQPQQQMRYYQHQSQAPQYPAAMPQLGYQQTQGLPPGFLPQQY
ncbi:hypothetical protein LTR86_000937 [Recurvomyces mirabilis]|nr:hypothetical protein LTR86_000937 [Recurvomyces mirabilis]